MRRTTIAAGVLYFVTHVTSVAALVLYGPVLNDADYIVGSGPDTRILVGGLLEVILACAVVGTAVALYPIVKRHSPGGALGYAALRTLEAATILAGVVTVLAVVTLRQRYAGAAGTDAAALTLAGQALVAVHDWTFLIGPGLVVGVNTVVLACTHFPLLLDRFVRLAPWQVNWIDPAPAIARRVVDLLGPAGSEMDTAGAEMIFTSGRPHTLSQALMPFFGGRVPA